MGKQIFKYDIGLVCNWSGFNYGAHITHYALYRYLSDCGYRVLMIEKTNTEPFKPLSTPQLFIQNPYGENDISKLYNSLEDMRELNDICSLFIVGSDQLWSYSYFGHGLGTFGLSFVSSSKRKISYATSFGKNRLDAPYSHINWLKSLLLRFDSVSVREKSGVLLCKSLGITATHVADPVFLLDIKIYEELMNRSCYDTINNYVFCYILHPNKINADLITRVSEYLSKGVICVGDALHPELYDDWNIEKFDNCMIEDWLKLIRNSSLVITDSFHALCFSIMFGKQVVLCGEDKDSLERAYSLYNMIGNNNIYTEDRLAKMDVKDILEVTRLDYPQVFDRLNIIIEKSKYWLNSAIVSEKSDRASESGMFDVFSVDYFDRKQEIYDLKHHVEKLEKFVLKSIFNNKYGRYSIIIFGAGNVGLLCAKKLNNIANIVAFSDNNPQKHGNIICDGVKCIPPDHIYNYSCPLVIMCINDKNAKEKIKEYLNEIGVTDIIDYEDLRKELLDVFL